MKHIDPIAFRKLWLSWYPEATPRAHELRVVYKDRWLRIHTLPDSSRIPDTRAKLSQVLFRLNAFATTVIGAGGQYVLLGYDYEGRHQVRPEHPLAQRLENPQSPLVRIAPDDEESEATSVFGATDIWATGSLDELFTLAATDQLRFMLVSLDDGSTFAPYDGGADATFPTSWERDAARQTHRDWLSTHPEGL